jgi:hypothetical protein
MTSTTIDTGKVSGRRELHFNTIDDALSEVDRLLTADRAARLTRLGNWTLGQTLGHLATWVNFSYDGNPLKPPLIIRLILRMRKKKFLRGSMPVGVRIPGVENGTLGIDLLSTDDGAARYRAAMQRLAREAPTLPNVIFGPLTHDEWKQLHLRHAELHLGFMKPQA